MAHIIGKGIYARETYPVPRAPGGGGGSAAFVDPVDTIARASASRLVDLNAAANPDGTLVFVRSVRDFFVLHKTSALAPDNITIADAVGGGQWLRKFTPSVRWLSQEEWRINPHAVDDEGAGGAADPLRSHAELGRRALNQGRTIDQNVTVTIEDSLPVTDPIELDLAQPIGDVQALNTIRYFGVPVTVRSGTLSAVSPLNSGVSLTSVSDAGGGSFAAEIGQRIRMTAGASDGARAWLVRDEGGDTAATSPFFLTPVPEGSIIPTLTDPTTDTYVVETLPSVRLGRVKMTQGPVNGAVYQLILSDLSVGTGDEDPPRCTNMDAAILRGCEITNHIWDKADIVAQGCAMKGPTFFNSVLTHFAGAILDSNYLCSASNVTIGLDTVAVEAPLVSASIFDCALQVLAASSFDSAGSGVTLLPSVIMTVSGRLWGTGNAQYGINARGGKLLYNPALKPTLTGLVEDTRVGGIDKSYADIPFFNAANGGCVVDTPT